MAHGYRNYSPDQCFLIAPDPREWLSADHLAYQVRDLVNEFDLTLIHSAYSSDGRGAPAFAPQMMLCILLYGQYRGVVSSRRLAEFCTSDIGARYLAGGNFPDHRSICLFRIRHRDAIRELFKQSVLLCRAAGMVSLKNVAIDGTKIAGAGSRDSSKTYEHIVKEEARISAEMDALVQAGLDIDAAENAQLGEDNDGYSLPDHLKSQEDRIAALRKAKAELGKAKNILEARAKECAAFLRVQWDNTAPKDRPHRKKPDPDTALPEPANRYNFTDPDSRLMKGRGQYVQGYNAQAGVDSAHQVIVACRVTSDCTDYAQLVPMAEQVAANVGAKPDKVTADAGYFAHRNISKLEEQKYVLLVAPDKTYKQDKQHDMQPSVTALELEEPEEEAAKPQGLTVRERMRQLLATPEGKADYSLRKITVEPVFAQIKGSPGNPGFMRFLRRSIKRADQDWCWICLGHNLMKLYRFRAKSREEASGASETVKTRRRQKRIVQTTSMTLLGI
jgi:transposase